MTIRLLNHHFNVLILLLAAGEASIMLLVAWLTIDVCGYTGLCAMPADAGMLLPVLAMFAVMAFMTQAMGLYQPGLNGYSSVIARMTIGFAIGAGVMLALAAIFPLIKAGFPALLLILLVSYISICLFRFGFSKAFDTQFMKRRVLVYGAGHKADRILKCLNEKPGTRGFVIVGFVHTEGDSDAGTEKTVYRPDRPLWEFAASMDIDEIVDAVDDRRSRLPMIELLDCKANGIDVTDLMGFLERESGSVNVGLLSPSWIIFSDGFRHTPMKRIVKRGLDVVIGAIALVAVLPVMLLAALAILIEDGLGAPVFYSQIRVGAMGRRFSVLKFRSMRTDAEGDGQAVWASAGDARITRVGRFLRKTRIDELPQIINVLKGDMSLVGPRPERPEFVGVLQEEIAFYTQRAQVKPGITGWAQLCYPYGASVEDSQAKLEYDLYYVKNHNLFLDLLIMLRTSEVILFGKGVR
jgi:sugar transferase (PEP-CTERM system associated)